MHTAELICLANSYKKRGRCIAGVLTDGSGWIRLNHPETLYGELYPDDYVLPDGSEPKAFDVIRVELHERQPAAHHPENWTVGPGKWELVRRPADRSAIPLLKSTLARGNTLLGDRGTRTLFAQYETNPARESLALIEPAAIRWTISKTESNAKKPRALFMHDGVWYNLPVTDPHWIPRLQELDYGKHQNAALRIADSRRVLLTISLSEEWDDHYCYKLVAGILLVSEDWRR